MKDKNNQVQKLMDCVYLFEDFIKTGYKKDHPKLHSLPLNTRGKTTIPGTGDTPRDRLPIKRNLTPEWHKQFDFLTDKIQQCTQCYLHYNRKHALPGSGVNNPEIFIIRSRPDDDEDSAGTPFNSTHREYVRKWLKAIHYSLDEHCYAAHLVRCRPPNNREPREDEVKTCFSYIREQISLLKPGVLLCLGTIPARVLTDEHNLPLEKLRGKEYSWNDIPIVVTYDPVAVLEDRDLRKPVWEDLKRLKRVLDKRSG